MIPLLPHNTDYDPVAFLRLGLERVAERADLRFRAVGKETTVNKIEA